LVRFKRRTSIIDLTINEDENEMKKLLVVLILASAGAQAQTYAPSPDYLMCKEMGDASARIASARNAGWSAERARAQLEKDADGDKAMIDWTQRMVVYLWDHPAVTPTMAKAWSFQGCMQAVNNDIPTN
jgi:hypothetical protein